MPTHPSQGHSGNTETVTLLSIGGLFTPSEAGAFVVAVMVLVLAIIFFPNLVLFLPNMLMGGTKLWSAM